MTASGLEARNLRVEFPRKGSGGGPFVAVDSVDIAAGPGETLGIVGESGCGKSTLLLALARLIPVAGGELSLDGTPAAQVADERWRREVQMVFQDPYSSLNPRRPVGEIVAEGLEIRRVGDRRSRTRTAQAMIERVGLPGAFIHRRPHELSGGERQRVAIARALALDPRVLLLDEPTSALDVSVQAHILNMLADLQRDRGMTYVFVSHDLGVVGHVADRVAVMCEGRVVETGAATAVLESPSHPYTRTLLAALPKAPPAIRPVLPARSRSA
jgi:ABC-type glutathione transport system ATPase component